MSYIVIRGKACDLEEVARRANVTTRTIRERVKLHPDWTFEQMTQGRLKEPAMVTHEGRTMTLEAWARVAGVTVTLARYRWRRGARTYDQLFGDAPPTSRLTLSPENRKWLEETRPARKGMRDEWKIACDLIGIDRWHAPELKALLDGGNA